MSDDSNNVVSIKDLKNNEKLPKGLIKRYPTEERKNGITDFRCSISKSYSYDRYTDLKVTGELKGRVTKYTLMMFMVYNQNDELIEADFDENISENFSGDMTFSVTLQVPSDEYITKIAVRFTRDPVFV